MNGNRIIFLFFSVTILKKSENNYLVILGGFYLSIELRLISVSKTGAGRGWKVWADRLGRAAFTDSERRHRTLRSETDSGPEGRVISCPPGLLPSGPPNRAELPGGEHAPLSQHRDRGWQGPPRQVGNTWPSFASEGGIALSGLDSKHLCLLPIGAAWPPRAVAGNPLKSCPFGDTEQPGGGRASAENSDSHHFVQIHIKCCLRYITYVTLNSSSLHLNVVLYFFLVSQ